MRPLVDLICAARHVAVGRIALSVVDIGLTSASAMILTVIAARSLTIDQFGSLGVFLIVVGVFQSVVQGGFVDVLLQRANDDIATGYWAVERWSPAWVVLAFVGTLSAVIDQRVQWFGLAAAAVGVGLLIVRQWWVRAFFFTKGRASASVKFSGIVFTTAVAWLAGSAMTGSFDWRLVVLSYATSYAVAGTVSYVAGRRLATSRNRGRPKARLWRWGYAVEATALVAGVQVASLLVVPSLGLQFSAGLRGAMLAMGPVIIMFSAFRMLALPHFANHSPGLRVLRYPAVVLIMCVASWWGCAALVLFHWGPALLGSTSKPALSLISWVALTLVTQGMYLVAFVAGRSWSLDRDVRFGRLVQLGGTLSGALLSVASHSEAPFFLGALCGNVLSSALLLWRFRAVGRPGDVAYVR